VPAAPPPSASRTLSPCIQFLAIIAWRICAKSRYANLGKTFESDGCDDISASFPYFRKRLYSVSWLNSAAAPPGLVGTNSTLIRQLGNRYRSSSHGFPTTRFVLIRRNGLNHGLMGDSFRYRDTSPRRMLADSSKYKISLPSTSLAVMPSGCENLTKAPLIT